MSINYLLDENLPPLYQEQLLRYQSDLTVLMIGELGAINTPQKGTLDPEIDYPVEAVIEMAIAT
ncbi:MAG: hypothetical protein AB4058_15975 [Microcystaceae cyanobacterium]